MTVVSTLERYYTTSGSTFVRDFQVTVEEAEKVFGEELDVEGYEYDTDVFNFMLETGRIDSDMEFITAILDEREGNFLIDYDDTSDVFMIYKIDGRTVG